MPDSNSFARRAVERWVDLTRRLLSLVCRVGASMLEQWEADHMFGVAKIYSNAGAVDLRPGMSVDYQLEDLDGHEFFLLDVRCSSRSIRKVRFQLRARRSIVLARLCTGVPHTNPDGQKVYLPHLHRYREGYEDRWATQVDSFDDQAQALEFFCDKINLPMPDIRGGHS